VAGAGTARGDIKPKLQGGGFVEVVAFDGRILDGAVAGGWPPGPLGAALPTTGDLAPATPSHPHMLHGLGIKTLYLIAQEEFARPCNSPHR
jgi:hypothetical protein